MWLVFAVAHIIALPYCPPCSTLHVHVPFLPFLIISPSCVQVSLRACHAAGDADMCDEILVKSDVHAFNSTLCPCVYLIHERKREQGCMH